jgi:hypothetical protein
MELMKESAKKPGPNVVPPGRPYFVAHIPIHPTEIEHLRLRFYDIMAELTYREQMAWCRGFGYSHATYLMRRYQHRNPSLEEVIITCAWDDNGRPVERKNRLSVALFYLDQVEQIKRLKDKISSSTGNSILSVETLDDPEALTNLDDYSP